MNHPVFYSSKNDLILEITARNFWSKHPLFTLPRKWQAVKFAVESWILFGLRICCWYSKFLASTRSLEGKPGAGDRSDHSLPKSTWWNVNTPTASRETVQFSYPALVRYFREVKRDDIAAAGVPGMSSLVCISCSMGEGFSCIFFFLSTLFIFIYKLVNQYNHYWNLWGDSDLLNKSWISITKKSLLKFIL